MKKIDARQRRKFRIRKGVSGTQEVPRLSVFRSDRYTYVQLIVDGIDSGKTVFSASTKSDQVKGKLSSQTASEEEKASNSTKSVKAAYVLGQLVADHCKANSINKVKFDRNGFLYHGRIKAVAEGLREGGVQL